VVFNAVNRKWKSRATSEKQSRPKYKIQPFARWFFDGISSVQLLAAKDSNVFISPKHLRLSDILSAVYYAFDTP